MYSDEAARGRIAADLNTTFLVEAGAGSGKTTSIVGRMIALVKTGQAEVRNIAAITFTKKAAAELMGRFRVKLEQELAKAADHAERERLAEALRQMPECFIGTIHAFCGRLLRERPIEAKVDPAFQEMDEQEDREFRGACWDDYLEELQLQGRGEAIQELAALQVNVEELRAVYNKVSEYEDVEIFTETVDRPDFDWIRGTLFPLLEEYAVYIPTVKPEKGWDTLQQSIRTALLHQRTKRMSDDMNVLALAKLFDRTLNVTLSRWTDEAMAREAKEKFAGWQTGVLKPFLQQWREFLHPKLIQFVLPAVAYCRTRRMEAGKLNFQDLLMKAAELLREHPEVRSYFGRRYSRLFVDEFQDTDPIQAEMMLLLTGSDEGVSDWRQQRPRPGSLFVVGDPKQSIYRFRRADISTYNFVKRRIAECGEVLQLTRNFRSVGSIGEFVNAVFEEKFAPAEAESDVQAPFVPMVTVKPNPGDVLHGVYTLTVPKMDRDKQHSIAAYDAERVAQFVAWSCGAGGAKPEDFLILLKHRKFIDLYAAMLEKYGIASDTSGSRAVFEEMHALYVLAMALGDPGDHVALLAVLRGMLYGVSDDELYHYRREGGQIDLLADTGEVSFSEKGSVTAKALRTLRRYLGWVKELPALAALSRITEDIGLVPAAAAGESGAIRSGTLLKLFEVMSTDAGASVDWAALTERLGSLLEQADTEAESLFAGDGNAVRIMNLHKAKGLEAPIVVLACPCADEDHDAAEHIDRMSEPPRGYFTITQKKSAYVTETIAQPAGWEAKTEVEREFMRAESDRLLYVAATRAKRLLVVSRYPSRPAIDPWSGLGEALNRQPELDWTPAEPVASLPAVPDLELPVHTPEPSYAVVSVTGLTKSAAGNIVLERPSEGGGGMAYGSLVHRTLQALGEGMDVADLALFIRLVAEEEGVAEEWLEQAEDTIRWVISSNLWQRAERARQKYHEFSLTVTQSDSELPTLLRGVIDLVFEEDDGWVIADFKTDRYDPRHEQQFVDYYRPQVLAYADEWTRLTGCCVKEAGLYFISSSRYIEL